MFLMEDLMQVKIYQNFNSGKKTLLGGLVVIEIQKIQLNFYSEVEKFKERKGKNMVDIGVVIYCERKSHKGMIIGKQGAMLKKIGSNARYEMERLLETKVNLKLWVKVKKDWRDSDFLIKNFGYREDQ